MLRSGEPFNYDTNEASVESGLRCDDVTRTQQQFREEADINTIVRRFKITGELPQGVVVPTYQDFDGVFDFQSAMNVVRAASEAFMAMPADVRARFQNSEQEFYNFVLNPENREEAEKLGLVVPKPAEAAAVSPAAPGAIAAPGGAAPV